MKEQKLDDLERMFRDGLQDLKAEPDAAVWVAIQNAMKKRRRFWLFWSITGMVAIGLVATILLQSETKLLSEEKGSEVLGSGSGVMGSGSGVMGSGSEVLGSGSGVLGSGSGVMGSGSGVLGSGSEVPGSGSEVPGSGSEVPGSGDEAEMGAQNAGHPEQANEFAGTEGTQRRVEGLANEFAGPEGTQRRVEGLANEFAGPEGAPSRIEGPETPSISSLRIPFIYIQPEIEKMPVLLTWNPEKPVDTIPEKAIKNAEFSPWSIDINPGILLPSIQSYGKTGMVNFEKTNSAKTGKSLTLYLNYAFNEKWMIRSGIDWSAYTVSGNCRYFGYTDTVEWIDRKRHTGYQVIEKSRSWLYESRYQWIGIPFEIGRRQKLGIGFDWDWTLGAGLNYLYAYDKIAEGNQYLGGIDESIRNLQFSFMAGFGVNYQIAGPWSTNFNVQYRLQPNTLYDTALLREKHQILRFGIGVQYCFKMKGN